MAESRMPAEFYDEIKVYLPPEKPVGPLGGCPMIPNETVVKVIYYVLSTGIRWRDVPPQMGCCGETARTRLRDWQKLEVWSQIHQHFVGELERLGRLDAEVVVIDSSHVPAPGGGESTGPSPVNRGKKGTKYSVLTDKNGVPLVIRHNSAGTSDHVQIVPTVLDIEEHGFDLNDSDSPPNRAYADAGYDSEATRELLRYLGIEPYIRRKGNPHGSHLGRVRWVVERTIGWIKKLHRLSVRYDRHDIILNAWESLAASIICYRLATAD